ncbi:phosphatidylinositol-specific phospholipase C/glycerophosphodiester phosphodiesterase family protein [Paenibacillus alba]|uniref:Phosphatidylinositol-specific phospholipase C/glycerophosphodiester phosphodiesterase family protein n=1 Tax=Paenibacillus alba TaxID=1197127 RepID=A0ABU6FWJ8_9BACL|nr:phosphatidylinositol-specific phospholipase C/glycerophosphodiester phosphodiesterase family protein [Paenibacillus alba]MEC0226268.1 phosphatidylinositol-specific phospholipase C/glycerophosphodiester phosphodiesterase family protein [Paenibacillus alba]
MKKTIMLSLFIVIMAGMIWRSWGLVWSGQNQPASTVGTSSWEENRLIAHALGGVKGASYTNSYEAFITNYNRGYRLFEVDLVQTMDGELVARHDWSQRLQPDLAAYRGRNVTKLQFANSLIMGRFHPLILPDILQLMQQYRDFDLIVDTKAGSKEQIQQQFTHLVNEARRTDPALLNRIIPEIFSPDMYDTVMGIYPFPNKIYSLYKTGASAERIVEFVRDKHLTAVAMPEYRVFVNPNLVPALNKLGVKSYVHTVNSKPVMQLLRSFGVYGFYTDQEESPEELMLATAPPGHFDFPGYISSGLASISNIVMKVRNNG